MAGRRWRAGRTKCTVRGLAQSAGFFPGFSPLAHLSNLKPTDPTASQTQGLGTPARRRRCRTAGRAQAPRTRPSWSCSQRPRWTWGGGRGPALAASRDRGRPGEAGLPRQITAGGWLRPPSPTTAGSSGLGLPPNNKGGLHAQTWSSRRGGPSWSHF